MSLFQQILTAEKQKSSWDGGAEFFIYEIRLADRISAEKAFEDIKPCYNKVWEKGTFDGIEATTGNTSHDDKKSAHSHLWVDENKNGFSLCVLFSNKEQRNEINNSLRIFFKEGDIKHHLNHINGQEVKRIRQLMTATHSVEMDVLTEGSAVDHVDICNDFANVAFTALDGQSAIYSDTIPRDGFKRFKAYFDSERAAQNFAQVADLKVRQPLKSANEMVSLMTVREFPNPIILPKQKVA